MLAPNNVAPYELMSPTLLAQQPIEAPKRDERNDKNWSVYFTYLESRIGSLRSWRWSWWAYWAVLARFFMARRYVWLVVANKMWRGHPINEAIIDTTAQQAVRTCAAGMWNGLTPSSRPWFKMGIALPWIELDPDGKAWLEDTEQRLYTVLSQSNFYTIMHQAFQDLTVFGTAPILIYEDAEDVARFYLPCAGEYYLANGGRLSINTHAREFTLNVQQIVDMFQIKNCPAEIVTHWQNGGANLDREYIIGHMIEPNFALDGRGSRTGEKIRLVPESFTWREIFWLKGIKTGRPLSAKGFRIQPFAALRCYLVSNDAYGRSFCMDALGDNKQVQTETLRKGEFLEKGVRPPMGADPELKNEPASTMPSMITYTNTSGGKKGFWPLFEVNPAWLTGITADIKEVNARINHCLFVDTFMAITQMEGVQPRNELELTKRDLERLQELGPVVDLAEKELDIIIMRVLDILERRRMLLPKPKSLANVPIKITYVSIMRIAQRSSEYVGMKDFLTTMGGLSSAAKAAGVPDPLRKVNLDKATTKLADVTNFPPELIYTDQEVEAHDQIRAKAMQQQQAPQQAMAAVDAAKTLATTPMGGNSALSALTGQGGAAPGSPA